MLAELKNFETQIEKISSWNLIYTRKALVIYPNNLKELQFVIKLLKKEKKNFSIRTGKCAYDSKSMPSNENGMVVSLKKFDQIIQINKKKETILLQAGVKVSEAVYVLKKYNSTLYSVPGGEHISIGGAIAANTIGKDSNKSFSSFGDSIKYLKIISYNGTIKKLKQNSKEFKKFIGSFGMFGMILEAEIKTKRIISNNLLVETKILKNTKEIEKELKKKTEYKYIQVDPFFRKDHLAVVFNANYIKNFEDNYKNKNFESNIIEKLFFKLASIFINSFTWKIFYKIFFKLNNNKKFCVDIHNFHYSSKYKHMIPLICNGMLLDYEILIKNNFKGVFVDIKNLVQKYNLKPIYIIIKKIFKSKKKFFYSFNDNGYALAISFSSKDISNLKKSKFEELLKKRKLLLNLSKTDSEFVKKVKKINSKENKVFMSLYKKMLVNR